jgi:putative membrane protein insertion efficiency factor
VIAGLAIVLVRMVRAAVAPFAATTSITPRVCKYEPTCSHYAEQAIRVHGPVKGLGMAAWRVLRCNPWSRGGYDPVVRP